MNRCPPDQQLQQLLDEQLAESESASLSTHIAGCERCQVVLERLTDDAAADEPSLSLPRARTAGAVLEPPPEFLARMRQTPPSAPSLRGDGRAEPGQGRDGLPAWEPFAIAGYEII